MADQEKTDEGDTSDKNKKPATDDAPKRPDPKRDVIFDKTRTDKNPPRIK